MELNLNVNDITLGDVADMEKYFGIKLSDIQKLVARGQIDLDDLPMPMMLGFIFLLKRVQDPSTTPESIRGIKMTDLETMIGAAGINSTRGDVDPTTGE